MEKGGFKIKKEFGVKKGFWVAEWGFRVGKRGIRLGLEGFRMGKDFGWKKRI